MMQRRAIARQKMFSVPHLVIIFLVALLVFGPDKLPELARKLGKVTAELRRATDGIRAGFEDHMRELERDARAAEERKKPAESTIKAPQAEPAEKTASAEEQAVVEPSVTPETHPTEVTAEKNRNGDAKSA